MRLELETRYRRNEMTKDPSDYTNLNLIEIYLLTKRPIRPSFASL
jgi:hypothetical protein